MPVTAALVPAMRTQPRPRLLAKMVGGSIAIGIEIGHGVLLAAKFPGGNRPIRPHRLFNLW
jgi:hypothetical protein